MIGTRLMSGSLAMSLMKRSIAATPSIIPSSMLTSMTCAPFSTCWRATDRRGVVVAVADQVAELRRAGDVGALADVDEQRGLGDGQRLEPGQPAGRRDVGRHPRRATSATTAAIARMWSGVVPQHPPRRLTRPLWANSSTMAAVWSGVFVVLAEGVGQPGVRVAGDVAVGQPGELGQVGPHLGRTERAVEPDQQWAGVAYGVPERLGDLPGQRAAGGVGDGAGDGHRPTPIPLLEQRLEREDRGLGVEGVEDRLDQQQVGAAVDQPVGLLEVGLDELLEA